MAQNASIGAPDQNELIIALVAAVGTDVGMVAEQLTIELSEYAYETDLLRLSNYLAEEFNEDFFAVKRFDEALWDAMTAGNTLRNDWGGARGRTGPACDQRHRRHARAADSDRR